MLTSRHASVNIIADLPSIPPLGGFFCLQTSHLPQPLYHEQDIDRRGLKAD